MTDGTPEPLVDENISIWNSIGYYNLTKEVITKQSLDELKISLARVRKLIENTHKQYMTFTYNTFGWLFEGDPLNTLLASEKLIESRIRYLDLTDIQDIDELANRIEDEALRQQIKRKFDTLKQEEVKRDKVDVSVAEEVRSERRRDFISVLNSTTVLANIFSLFWITSCILLFILS